MNTLQHRSEIAFIIDAKDCNPNGDPLTADNEPRIDPVTGQCVVTDVRLKRYLRDQLEEDGEVVLIKSPTDNVLTREEMYDAVEEEMDVDMEDAEPAELIRGFVDTATDVRYFGATIAIDTDLADDLPDHAVSAATTVQPDGGEYRVMVPLANPEHEHELIALASAIAKQRSTTAVATTRSPATPNPNSSPRSSLIRTTTPTTARRNRARSLPITASATESSVSGGVSTIMPPRTPASPRTTWSAWTPSAGVR